MTFDITFQDGDFKHPYLVALVRWCVSSFWTTATVILHRLLTAPLPPNTASKPTKPRPASSDHLHPEPLVECVVLHTPIHPTIDVIFVHGLYGSLANTWRQGEWMTKYDKKPTKVPLRRPHSIPTCKCVHENDNCSDSDQKTDEQVKSEREHEETDVNNEDIKIIPQEEIFALLNQNDVQTVIPKDSMFMTEKFYSNTLLDKEKYENYEAQAQFVQDLFKRDIHSDKVNSEVSECKCTECVGCGCVCDECYSPCWPRDWIRADYPGARVISINYTSDPHLWRPLWVKESKRLRLHERAEQMMCQLLELGVGERPIIWVGHSKGGLFIKQIYCEAYEAHLKTKDDESRNNNQNTTECTNDNRINHSIDKTDNCDTACDINDNVQVTVNNGGSDLVSVSVNSELTSDIEEEHLIKRSKLWSNSAGFMFYSVPHRGSPLADIKTPITARSVELMEICKDCPLVLSLQARWLAAAAPSTPVRSLVETCRTLMSVLYLRIVSVHSADSGIGSLHGVSVDHREICKPTSRHCLLYQELMTLMKDALKKYEL